MAKAIFMGHDGDSGWNVFDGDVGGARAAICGQCFTCCDSSMGNCCHATSIVVDIPNWLINRVRTVKTVFGMHIFNPATGEDKFTPF